MGNISERVGREFRRFQLDMLRTSRDNIFAHAREIDVKRQAVEDICRSAEAGEITPEDEERADGICSILDAVYCCCENERAEGRAAPAQGAALRWLAGLRRQDEKNQEE